MSSTRVDYSRRPFDPYTIRTMHTAVVGPIRRRGVIVVKYLRKSANIRLSPRDRTTSRELINNITLVTRTYATLVYSDNSTPVRHINSVITTNRTISPKSFSRPGTTGNSYPRHILPPEVLNIPNVCVPR